MQINLRLVNFTTPDHFLLPGLLYESNKKTDKAVIFLHGNGSASIFYKVDEINLFAKYLNEKGIAFFPFNNRGAHWIKKLNRIADGEKERVLYGMAYELIKECILDIEGAVKFLKGEGYKKFYLIGESTGANKIVVYHYYRRKNRITKYILLSGGDDVSVYLNFYFKKDKRFLFEMIKKCKDKIKKGKGRELVSLELIPDPLISYQSLYDTINPEGDYNIFPFDDYLHKLKLSRKPLFREFKTIDKPTLVVYGELDEYGPAPVRDCVEVLKKECSDPKLFTFKIIKDTDHGMTGKEEELIKHIIK